MAFNKLHTKHCAINTKSSLANCTCGVTNQYLRGKIKQLQAELAETKQEGDTMWKGLNLSIVDLQAELKWLKDGIQFAISGLPEYPDRAKDYLEQAQKGIT